MRVAPPIVLTEDQKRTLQQWARGRSLPARQVERARVVLLAAAGKQDLEIAADVGIAKAFRSRRANALGRGTALFNHLKKFVDANAPCVKDPKLFLTPGMRARIVTTR